MGFLLLVFVEYYLEDNSSDRANFSFGVKWAMGSCLNVMSYTGLEGQ